MLATVQLNHNSGSEIGKVSYIRRDRMLPPKAIAFELIKPKMLPELLLLRCHLPPQFLREFGERFRHARFHVVDIISFSNGVEDVTESIFLPP